MNVLDKILDEINVLIEKHKNKAYELAEKEPLTQCYTETDIEQIKVHELAAMKEIIRSHMDDATVSKIEQDGWIPTSKNGIMELPENRTEVWVSRKGLVQKGMFLISSDFIQLRGFLVKDVCYINGEKFFNISDVDAWKPYKRPEPYKEE